MIIEIKVMYLNSCRCQFPDLAASTIHYILTQAFYMCWHKHLTCVDTIIWHVLTQAFDTCWHKHLICGISNSINSVLQTDCFHNTCKSSMKCCVVSQIVVSTHVKCLCQDMLNVCVKICQMFMSTCAKCPYIKYYPTLHCFLKKC
jgi:hypothetical protein